MIGLVGWAVPELENFELLEEMIEDLYLHGSCRTSNSLCAISIVYGSDEGL